MKLKTKIILNWLIISLRNYSARKIARKAKKIGNEDRYPLEWRNDKAIKYAKKFVKLFKVDLKITGFDNIPKQSCILAPNHSSALDGAFIMAALENPNKGPDYENHKTIFIAKKELEKNKRLKGYAGLINTFYIDRKNPRTALKVFDEVVEEIKESKRHVVIFPEGTRSKDGEIQEFKGGAFRIAKKAFLPIVPITINNALSVTNLGRDRKIEVHVIIHKLIKPMSFISSDTKSIAKKVQKAVQSAWIKPEGKRDKLEKKMA